LTLYSSAKCIFDTTQLGTCVYSTCISEDVISSIFIAHGEPTEGKQGYRGEEDGIRAVSDQVATKDPAKRGDVEVR
jgi:hypothetical protein